MKPSKTFRQLVAVKLSTFIFCRQEKNGNKDSQKLHNQPDKHQPHFKMMQWKWTRTAEHACIMWQNNMKTYLYGWCYVLCDDMMHIKNVPTFFLVYHACLLVASYFTLLYSFLISFLLLSLSLTSFFVESITSTHGKAWKLLMLWTSN